MVDDDDENNEICNTRLRLGIGALDDDDRQKQKKISSSKRVMSLDLCFPNFHDHEEEREKEREMAEEEEEEEEEEERQSITSNNLNANANANGDHHRRDNSNNDGGGRSCARKKLRLTQEQSTVLEDSFKLHTTLNTAQKQALSEKLNLRPRQVEVWFQNRRARTKLKQTEVDCEFLKKYCENLRDENRRLKKEVQELRSSSSLLLFQENLSKLQNSSAVLCPSCDQKMVNRSTTTTTTTSSDADDVIAVHKPKPHLPNPSGFNFFSNH